MNCHLLAYPLFSEMKDGITKLHFCLAMIRCSEAYIADL